MCRLETLEEFSWYGNNVDEAFDDVFNLCDLLETIVYVSENFSASPSEFLSCSLILNLNLIGAQAV